jgi:hypothetical protein
MSSKKKKPQDFQAKREVTSAGAWKGKKAGSTFDLELPSGNVCKVRRTDMPTLLASGAFPDSLMAIVSEKIDTATGKKDKPKELSTEEVQSVMGNPDQMVELFSSIDRLVPIVVVEPKVVNHKVEDGKDSKGKPAFRDLTDEEREALGDVVFTDEVDLEDKMFIFQFVVGGKSDVEGFRNELGSAVGDLSAN